MTIRELIARLSPERQKKVLAQAEKINAARASARRKEGERAKGKLRDDTITKMDIHGIL